MVEEIIYSMEAPYREKLQVRGYHFGKKEEKTAKPVKSEELKTLEEIRDLLKNDIQSK